MNSRKSPFVLRNVVAGGVVVTAMTALAWLAGAGLAGTGSSSPGAAQSQYGQKVTICHHTHSKKHPTVTITVSRSALKAHLRHGDTIGSCADAKAQAKAKAVAAAKAKARQAKQNGSQPATKPTPGSDASKNGHPKKP